jgi:NAD(P)-dependent dehydrogenase (short-subunit alcohol dehydrogenase family)
MAGRVAGKVAFITGAARGQGRAHAVRLAEEGADIIAIDVCHDYDTVGYPLATEADLAETAKAVEVLDRRIVATVADVRDAGALKAAAAERGIVALRAPLPSVAPELYQRLVADAVAVTRATREHPDIRQGSSVRGAIDLTLVAGQLLELRGPAEYPELVYDAMVVALSGRIFLDETVEATPEAVLRQIWEDQFILTPAAAAPG